MDVVITLQHGPIEIEIQAEEDEEYQDKLIEIADFLDENQEHFAPLAAPSSANGANDDTHQTPMDSRQWDAPGSGQNESVFEPISRRTDVDSATLGHILDMPDNEDEVPSIIIAEFEEGEEILGTSRSEQQARASLILLFIWQELRDVEEVPSSKLGDALHMSGIDPENMYNMCNSLGGDADRYFNRTSGNPTVALSRQGERAAIDEIQRIADVE